ncbi:alpha/beta fold hydrolase [Hymenobacter caeli]|uniref:Pimeloyl-ACP methyl ester carboxylesterase n=1 Tax=Hymenobacter caeli TaxID=2735894 RepID=A0ABX2FPP1_9BACT|nr:alpha/beta hydrolase [Hymenobacter caeli]NRT18813.1 pimeloyl-ACP methyl ester carboxylesterase [Hymenobacter caeli]
MSEEPVFYLIPGLGADERVFQRWQLAGAVHVLQWLPPQSAAEGLPHYAARLAAAVPPGQPCWVVGVSFGGLLALEVARLRPRARAVLVSSLAGPHELRWLLRLARATGLYRLVPPALLQQMPRLAGWAFGVKTRGEYALLRQIIADTDPAFARWAIGQLLRWPGVPGPGPAARLHGGRDRLLPAPNAGIDYLVADAGHFLVVSHAAPISRFLNQLAAAAGPQDDLRLT